jgi:hypothetical protein
VIEWQFHARLHPLPDARSSAEAGALQSIVQDPVMLAIQVCRCALFSMTTRPSACH